MRQRDRRPHGDLQIWEGPAGIISPLRTSRGPASRETRPAPSGVTLYHFPSWWGSPESHWDLHGHLHGHLLPPTRWHGLPCELHRGLP